MELPDILSGITTEGLMATMEADLSAFLQDSPDQSTPSDYLRNRYPQIYDFIEWVKEDLPFESEEELLTFAAGGTFLAVALLKSMEATTLPSVD